MSPLFVSVGPDSMPHPTTNGRVPGERTRCSPGGSWWIVRCYRSLRRAEKRWSDSG